MLEKTKAIQPKVQGDLVRAFNENRFPRSVLFAGGRYTGRLTSSLECAKELLHVDNLYRNIPNLYLSLSRSYATDLSAKASLYKKHHTRSSFQNFLDTFFIVLLSESFASMREEYGVKATKDSDSAGELINTFNALLDISDSYDDKDRVEPLIDKVLKLSDKIKPSPVFSIKDVRAFKASSELHTAEGGARIYIVEELENASIGAKNAFLKLLEEPPENSYIFILSEVKERLLETILSRLTTFTFLPLPNSVKNGIIVSYNEDGRKFDSLEDFFLTIGFEESNTIKTMAKDFACFTLSNKDLSKAREIALQFAAKSKEGNAKTPYLLKIFSNEVFIEGKRILSEREESTYYLQALLTSLSKAESRVNAYNQSLRNSLLILLDDLIKL